MEQRDKYLQWMHNVLLLFAVATNISPAVTVGGIIVGCLLVIFYRVKIKSWPTVNLQLAKVFGVYFLLWICLSFASVDPINSLNDVFATFYRIFPLFFALIAIRDAKQLYQLLVAFSISVFIMDVVSILQWFDIIKTKWAPRATGLSNCPTFLGSHMLMALPVIWWCYIKETVKFRKILWMTLAVLSVVTLIASGTRGAWISFVIVVIIYVFSVEKNFWRAMIKMGALILLGGLLLISMPSVKDRVHTVTDMSYSSNHERLLMWQSSLNIIKDFPLFGIGADEFALVYNSKYILPQAIERASNPDDPTTGHSHPHNNLFKRFSEGGIIGGGAFVLLQLFLLWKLIKIHRASQMRHSYALMGVLIFIGFHLEGMTDTNITYVPVMREFWFLLGIAFIADKVKRGV